MPQMQIRLECIFFPASRTDRRDPSCEDVARRFTPNLGLLAVGRCLCDLDLGLHQEIVKMLCGTVRIPEAVCMQYSLVSLTSTILFVIILVTMLYTTATGSGSIVEQEPVQEQVTPAIRDLMVTSMDAEQVEMLKQEVANKQCQLELANSKLEAMAVQVAKLEAALLQSQKHAALQDERLNCVLREKGELSEMLKLEVETYEVLLEQAHEKAQQTTKTVANQLALLQAELEQAREQSALQDELLDRARQEKGMLELEVEACEALLEQEHDQAERIVSTVKRNGCPLDTDSGMKSKYAKDALNGRRVSSDSSIIVNYENSLSNPVGAIVYAHDEQRCATEIICAFATPRRGITAANLGAIREYARRQGDDKLVLEAVGSAEKFWQRMGFIADDEQSGTDLIRMSMPLGVS